MPGGLTKKEFDGLREDLQVLLSEHPAAEFTIIFLDKDGNRTEDRSKAVRYGMRVHEHDQLLFEEFGDVEG